MNRILLLLITALGLLSPSVLAQAKASGNLYSRLVEGEVQFIVVVDIDPDYHLYHHDLGAPDAVGRALSVDLIGEGVEFDELVWPDPHRYIQEGIGEDGGDTFILGHEDQLILYGHGKLTGTEADISVELNGLTCEDNGSCFQYEETLTSKGAGRDRIWSKYPAANWSDAAPAESEASGAESFGFGAEALDAPDDDLWAHGTLYSRIEDGQLEVGIVIDIDEGMHLFHRELGGKNATGKPLLVTLDGEGFTFGEQTWTKPHSYPQEDYMDGGETFILGHETRLVIHATASLEDGADASKVTAKLSGQTCKVDGTCFLYNETLTSKGEGNDDLWAELQALGTEPEEGDSEEESEGEGLMSLILAAIGGGIFALMMPCTYPMIPITISFFTKQAESRGGKVLPLSLMYGAGIVLIFVVIGLLVGPVILVFATHPVTNILLGAMFVVFSAALFGAITLNPPAFMMNMAGKASMTGGLAGVFLMGMTLVLTSFTCTAPFVGSLLSIAAGDGEGGAAGLIRIAIGMGVFGLTMAIPFTILSLVPGKIQSMPSSGEWMNTLKVSLGFIELAAALKFFSNADLVWGWDFLSRELFLLMWMLIFLFGGFYLLGWIKVKGHSSGEIGAGRMMSALGFLLFGAYCWTGYNGHSMDNIMTAIIPPYSSAPQIAMQYGGGEGGSAGPRIVEITDNHELAVATAAEQNKPVFINFTGFT